MRGLTPSSSPNLIQLLYVLRNSTSPPICILLMLCWEDDLSLSSHTPIFFHLVTVTPMFSVVLAVLVMHLLPGVSLIGFDSDRG